MNRSTPSTRSLVSSLIVFTLLLAAPEGNIAADDDKALREQRREAQQERQEAQKARSIQLREARKEIRSFARELEQDYREKTRDLDTQFELKRVDIEAEHESREAEALAEYQKKTAELFRQPDLQYDAQTVRQLWGEWKTYSDKLFDLKKQFAERLHNEKMAHERRKNELLTKRDNKVLAEAKRLGLTREYKPILASPIGDGLTQREQGWNEREQQKVERIHERNARLLSEFRTGARLRKWEIEHLQEDFELEWREKSELQALDTEQVFLNTLVMQQASSEVNRHTFGERFAELNKERELARIEYDKIQKQNRIERREQRKNILKP